MVYLTKKKEENKNTLIQNQLTTVKNNINLGSTKKKLDPIKLHKTKSNIDIIQKKTEKSEKKEHTITKTHSDMGETNEKFNKDKESVKEENNSRTQSMNQIQENEHDKTRSEISVISGLYAMNKRKLRNPGDFFNMYQDEFDQGYKDLFSPIKILFKKTKEPKKQLIKSKSNIVLVQHLKKI